MTDTPSLQEQVEEARQHLSAWRPSAAGEEALRLYDGALRRFESAVVARERAAASSDLQALQEALRLALEHTNELEDAWASGALHDRDGQSGVRSNRNVTVNRALRALLSQERGEG